jgi:hypothetical protein
MEHNSSHSEDEEVKYSVDAERIPLKPSNLLNLFIRPEKFFSSQLAFEKTPYLLFVTLCFGMANVVDRIDSNLMKADYGATTSSTAEIWIGIAQSWITFWLVVLIMGAVSGFFIWLIGGWWYKMRLLWSGAIKPDKEQARYVFIYSSFIYTGPIFLTLLLYTILYPNYLVAYAEDIIFSSLILVLLFYSIFVSYKGATTVFEVVQWKARLWFILLPIIFYLIILGAIGYLFSVTTS